MASDTEQTKNKRPVSGGTTKEWVVSTIAGVVSGAVVAAAGIRSEFGEIVKTWAGIADIKDVTGKVVVEEGLTTKLEKELNRLDLECYENPSKGWREHAADKFAAKKKYADDIVEILKNKYHLVSKGPEGLLKGTYQRYFHIGDATKKEAIFYKGATIAVVIGVGVYNLLTSIATRKKAREIEDLILDKVLEEPMARVEAAHRAMHFEPETKVTQVVAHERLQAANAPEMAVRA